MAALVWLEAAAKLLEAWHSSYNVTFKRILVHFLELFRIRLFPKYLDGLLSCYRIIFNLLHMLWNQLELLLSLEHIVACVKGDLIHLFTSCDSIQVDSTCIFIMKTATGSAEIKLSRAQPCWLVSDMWEASDSEGGLNKCSSAETCWTDGFFQAAQSCFVWHLSVDKSLFASSSFPLL